MTTRKEFFFNVSASLTYRSETGFESCLKSALVSVPTKSVPSSALNHATRVMIQQLVQTQEIDPIMISDIAIVSVSPLGLMSPLEFYDLSGKPTNQTGH